MDSIKFYLNDYEIEGESFTEVVVAINGEPLLELIKRCEQSFAVKEGQASIAGDYAYLSLIDFKKLFLDALLPNGRLAASEASSYWAVRAGSGTAGISRLRLNLKRTRSDLATLRTRAAKIGSMGLSLNLTA